MGQQPGAMAAEARQVMAAVPAGWQWLGRSRSGTDPGGCHVLANPAQGLALVDVAPEATPRAEARLRAALHASGFAYAFSGMLPVVHVRVEPSGLGLVAPLLEGGFAAQPALGIVRPGWPQAVANTLASRPDWSEADAEPAPRHPRLWRRARWGLAGLALVATFIGGLLVGANIVAVPQAALAPVSVSATPAKPPPAEAPPAEAEPPAMLPPAVEMQAEATPAQPVPPRAVPAQVVPAQPVQAQPVQGQPVPAQPAQAQPVQAQAMAAEPALAQPAAPEPLPAEPPPSRPRPALVRRTLEIDPGCAEAVLRYQQGDSLSWSEMSHVRNGCRSVVRR